MNNVLKIPIGIYEAVRMFSKLRPCAKQTTKTILGRYVVASDINEISLRKNGAVNRLYRQAK